MSRQFRFFNKPTTTKEGGSTAKEGGSTTKEGGSTTKKGGSRQLIANMSMVELSSRVKKRTGKAWGGHWSKRHGALLHFVQTHCLTGEVRASCKSGVRLLAQ
jgi:hypothetical protein